MGFCRKNTIMSKRRRITRLIFLVALFTQILTSKRPLLEKKKRIDKIFNQLFCILYQNHFSWKLKLQKTKLMLVKCIKSFFALFFEKKTACTTYRLGTCIKKAGPCPKEFVNC